VSVAACQGAGSCNHLWWSFLTDSTLSFSSHPPSPLPGSITEMNSIPNAGWWSLVSTTTVGFGEMGVTTGWGQVT